MTTYRASVKDINNGTIPGPSIYVDTQDGSNVQDLI